MSNIIEVKDPRGIKVTCTNEQWKNHIILDPTGHPIMVQNIPAIIDTIKSPDYIYESKDSDPPLDYREVYSKKAESATYYNSKAPYTKVVVANGGGNSEMITAFPARDPIGGTKGEAIYDAHNKG